jgi:hypothetical protein
VALKLLLKIAFDFGVKALQVFNDSLMIVNWLLGKRHVYNLELFD